MKNLIIVLLSIFCFEAATVQSQTKKVAKQASSKSPVRKKGTVTKTTQKPAVVVTQKTVTTKKMPAQQKEAISSQQSQTSVESKRTPAQTPTQATAKSGLRKGSSSYEAALGLKFLYGISLTGKLFLNEKSALEGILRYNDGGGSGTNIGFTGMYEHHGDIKTLAGLRWYLGGGGHVNYFSWDVGGEPVTTFGVAGIIGLEYKIPSLPIAISADWQPGYIINHGIGFSAENGGIGVKYTF